MFRTDPIDALLQAKGPGVLAIITDLVGPFYRPVGAMMAVLPGRRTVGSLSSGCVEADIALQAQDALADAAPRVLRYGVGSPFVDIRLPCGGGMEVLLLPTPALATLQRLQTLRAQRRPCRLVVDTVGGGLSVAEGLAGAAGDGSLVIPFEPPLRLVTFGDGEEAAAFASLAVAAGYAHVLLSGNEALLARAQAAGSQTVASLSAVPWDALVDARTGVLLFYHDHDKEPKILAQALETSAFYIGAQGSQRARDTRLAALRDMGVEASALDRLSGPIGLIPSVRDPQTLAISVLAEVVARATA